MPGIFPSNGRPPGDNNRGVPLTIATEGGCEALYYDESCEDYLFVDQAALNAMINEFVSVINSLPGHRYDCAQFDNLLLAIQGPV